MLKYIAEISSRFNAETALHVHISYQATFFCSTGHLVDILR